jgi:hypothetical protein
LAVNNYREKRQNSKRDPHRHRIWIHSFRRWSRLESWSIRSQVRYLKGEEFWISKKTIVKDQRRFSQIHRYFVKSPWNYVHEIGQRQKR